MVYIKKITRFIAPALLLASLFFAVPVKAASTNMQVKLRNHCHRDGCEMKMKTNQENKISVLTNEDFFLAQNMMRRHRHFKDFLPVEVFARKLTIVDRDAPDNTFNLKNKLTGPNSVNINEVTINVSDAIFRQIERNVFLNQNVSISVNTGDNTISFNTVVGNITTGDVSISLH